MKKRIYRNILTLAAFALILILGVCVSFFGNGFRSHALNLQQKRRLFQKPVKRRETAPLFVKAWEK